MPKFRLLTRAPAGVQRARALWAQRSVKQSQKPPKNQHQTKNSSPSIKQLARATRNYGHMQIHRVPMGAYACVQLLTLVSCTTQPTHLDEIVQPLSYSPHSPRKRENEFVRVAQTRFHKKPSVPLCRRLKRRHNFEDILQMLYACAASNEM